MNWVDNGKRFHWTEDDPIIRCLLLPKLFFIQFYFLLLNLRFAFCTYVCRLFKTCVSYWGLSPPFIVFMEKDCTKYSAPLQDCLVGYIVVRCLWGASQHKTDNSVYFWSTGDISHHRTIGKGTFRSNHQLKLVRFEPWLN